MPTLVVDPAQYAHAADSMTSVAHSTQSAVSSLAGELGASSGMAGSDNAGTAWADSYDQGARAALDAATSAVGAVGNIATRLHATGANHAHADASSVIGGGGDAELAAAPVPPTMSAPSVPSAAGGSGGGPPGWSMVEGLVGYVWPNGHQDRLHAADAAWKAAAAQLQDAAGPTSAAASAVSAQQSPEAAAAAQACTDAGSHLRELSSVFTELGSSCSEYAAHLDQAHHEIIHELESLLAQTVAIESLGAIAGFFTAGIGELAGQAIETARLTAAANRIREIIEALIAAARAVAASIGRLAARATDVLARLEKLEGSGVVRSAVAAAAKTAAGGTRAIDAGTAAFRVPAWARPELARATDSAALRSDLLSKNVPKEIADEAAANNPYEGMSPNKVVDDFFDTKEKQWKYPDNNGFRGEPEVSQSIPAGTQLDRIGGEHGEFLGRFGDSYSERALCPGKSAEYFRYEGTGESVPGWEVQRGPIDSAFAKPGGGEQWLVVDTTGERPVPVTVEQMLNRLIRPVPLS